MADGLLGVGDFASASGLTASSLRFYDARGILPPDLVDETGRRWYSPDRIPLARLVAALRATRAPLEVVRAVAAGHSAEEYLLGLEDLTSDLRRAIAAMSDDGDPTSADPSPSASVAAADLRTGLTAVVSAVGRDPMYAATHSVRVAVDAAGVELEATDRHRLMRWRVKARTRGSGSVAVPAARVAALAHQLRGEVALGIRTGALAIDAGTGLHVLAAAEFPATAAGILPDRSLGASAPATVAELRMQIGADRSPDRVHVDATPGRPPSIARFGPGRVFSARLLAELLWSLPPASVCALLEVPDGPLWILPISRRAEIALMPILPD